MQRGYLGKTARTDQPTNKIQDVFHDSWRETVHAIMKARQKADPVVMMIQMGLNSMIFSTMPYGK